jgi:hypothetical protein
MQVVEMILIHRIITAKAKKSKKGERNKNGFEINGIFSCGEKNIFCG